MAEQFKNPNDQAEAMKASPYAKGDKFTTKSGDETFIIGENNNGQISITRLGDMGQQNGTIDENDLKKLINNQTFKKVIPPKKWQPLKETIWDDPSHPLYGIAPSDQNVDFLKSAIAEITRNTQSPAHFKFYAGGSGGTMGQAKKQLERYKKALDYIENFGRRK